MEIILKSLDIIIHLDKYLSLIATDFGPWIYSLLFVIIFAETGLVIMPFLPGDSLLFAAGALAAQGALSIELLIVLLFIAGVLGDAINYWIGRVIGPKVFKYEDSRFLKKEYLEKTHDFYAKYGSKTIILARFLPIVRTFAPFVAGIGKMSYRTFTFYNIIGTTIWVFLFLEAGYVFGNIEVVKANFSVVILIIIILSIVPSIVEYYRSRRNIDNN
ncbi:MAG: hypothetical protein COV57_03565 [Candidatus Liptonbacteria bacterium CG11_big_fil_rev_8_21_14_0_20_35_14]|uniref:VTT domain-containing protein n=1 Tax=Candidatus Liptonbacteria bacterium CG11_big_fil_rev_8_21_14_0_20_35_14 TaxID=1974634 RepID=A0A2H0N6W6_9BACT|nr:MAG: hypothetical protein COV57_03565 [Candidatus Liptonbacteria bacterium CG11_big_fil_rev_8_21_14_0_20_35_14]